MLEIVIVSRCMTYHFRAFSFYVGDTYLANKRQKAGLEKKEFTVDHMKPNTLAPTVNFLFSCNC